MGANEFNRSFIHGFGPNSWDKVHHRNIQGVDDNPPDAVKETTPFKFKRSGALIGGPTAVNTFTNSVVAYTCTESGCDYNAGITQTLGATGPFVGGYYLGEIGKQNLTSNAKGVGGGFSATNIYSRAATSIVYKNGPTNYVEKTPLLQSGSGPVQQYRLNGSRIANINNKSAGMIVAKDALENTESARIFIKK
jgi:hypothetical protein